MTGIPFTIEHVKFLWVLLCIYVFSPTSEKPTIEYLPSTKTLPLSQSYALGTLLLALVYQAMSKFIFDEPYHRVGGALWFVQMWLFAYFLELLDRDHTFFKTLRLHPLHSLHTMPSNDLMFFFLGLVDRAQVHLFFKPDSIHISNFGFFSTIST